MKNARLRIALAALGAVAVAPLHAADSGRGQAAPQWENVAPGVWTSTVDGWTAIRVKRAEGESWLRARLEQELAASRRRQLARPGDSRPGAHVASLEQRLAHLDASASQVGQADAAGPSPDLPPSTYCWYVDGAVGPRTFSGQVGASATGVASSCTSSSNYVRVDACDSYACAAQVATHPYKAQAYTDKAGSGPRGCAGESYAANGDDVFWLQKFGFACW